MSPERGRRRTRSTGHWHPCRKIVGGTIEAVYPFEEPVALICNDEGKLLGLPLNRVLFDPDTHALLDVIAGIFFLCGAPGDSESFISLTEEQVQAYKKRFASPEQFINVGGSIFVLPQNL